MGQDNHIAIIETKTFTDKIYHLPKSMIPDHRYLNEANEAFLRLNRKSFEFLNINGYSQNGDLHIVSHNFVGAIPIRMPGKGKGKPVTDLIVKPRYGNSGKTKDWFEWMAGLAEFTKIKLEPERKEQLELVRSAGTPTPQYLLAAEVIKCFLLVIRKGHWNQFMNQELLADRPVGNVNWNRYAKQTVDPRRRLKFPTRLNLMTQEHDEFQRALQLYKKAKLIIEGRMTPNNIKQQLYSTLLQLDRLLPAATRLTMQMIEPFRVSMQDANEIKNLKTSLNAFMLNQEKQKYAWRIDFSKLFEGYTQRLIGQVAVYSTNNRRIPRTLMPGFRNKVSRLMPLYLEPDIVAEFGGEKIILDSKYKSYFFPRNKESKLDQRQRLRSDIHQIIAYTSLEKAKIAIILAPVEENQIIEEMVKYGDIIVGTLGIPLQYEHAHQYSETIRNYFKKVTNLLA